MYMFHVLLSFVPSFICEETTSFSLSSFTFLEFSSHFDPSIQLSNLASYHHFLFGSNEECLGNIPSSPLLPLPVFLPFQYLIPFHQISRGNHPINGGNHIFLLAISPLNTQNSLSNSHDNDTIKSYNFFSAL